MTPKPSRMIVAQEAWGDVPDWVAQLVTACEAKGSSQNRIAKRLGYSGSVISQIIRNSYAGNMANVEAVVRVSPADLADELTAKLDAAFAQTEAALADVEGPIAELRDKIIDKIAPIEPLDGQSLIDRIQASLGDLTPVGGQSLVDRIETSIGALDAPTSLSARIDTERARLDLAVPRLTDAQTALDQIDAHLISLGVSQFYTDKRIADAGIYIDPETRTVRIAALEHTAERFSEVQITIDAVKAELTQRATVSYVRSEIGQALLTPDQNPLVNDLVQRTTLVETTLNAETARIDSLSETLTVEGGLVTMASVLAAQDSLSQALTQRVTIASFDAQVFRLDAVEQALQAIPDGAEIVAGVEATRRLGNAVDDLDAGRIADLWGQWQQDRHQERAAAQARQELRATVDERLASEAAARLQLRVEADDLAAALATEQRVRAEAAQVTGRQVLDLSLALEGVRTDAAGQAQVLDDLTARVSEGETGLQAEAADRQILAARVGRTEDEADDLLDASIPDLWARFQADRHIEASLALSLREVRVRINEGDAAEAAARDVLGASLEITSAELVAERQARAAGDAAEASERQALATVLNHPETGLAQTRADLASERQARADADGAEASSRQALAARVGRSEDEADDLLDASIADLWARFQSDRAIDASLALSLREVRVRINEGDAAEASAREVLAAAVENASARLFTEESARVEGDRAEAAARALLSAEISHPETGLAQTRADLATERQARIDADTAEATDRQALAAVVNNPETGLAQTRADLATERQARIDADTAEATERQALAAVINHPETGLAQTRADLATEAQTRANADSAEAVARQQIAAQLNHPETGLARTRAELASVQATKVDAAGALAAVSMQVSAQYADLEALAEAAAFAQAQADRIRAGYVWRLNGESALELVSVADGTGGSTVTALIAADYVRITGLTQIDTAVIEELVADDAFIGTLRVGRAQIADELESDNYAEDAAGLPTAGSRWDMVTGTLKTAGIVMSRELVLAEGTLTYPGGFSAGSEVVIDWVNTGIRIGTDDVWRTARRTLLAVAQIVPASASGASETAIWAATCEVHNAFKWFGREAWDDTMGFPHAWTRDPPVLVTPPWASGTDQRVMISIRLFAQAIALNGPITVNWKVFEVT